MHNPYQLGRQTSSPGSSWQDREMFRFMILISTSNKVFQSLEVAALILPIPLVLGHNLTRSSLPCTSPRLSTSGQKAPVLSPVRRFSRSTFRKVALRHLWSPQVTPPWRKTTRSCSLTILMEVFCVLTLLNSCKLSHYGSSENSYIKSHQTRWLCLISSKNIT